MEPSISQNAYYQTHRHSAWLNGREIHFYTKPGLAESERPSPAEVLLTEQVELEAGEQCLFLGCGIGIAATALARRYPGAQLQLFDLLLPELQIADQTLQANQVDNARVSYKAFPSQALKEQVERVVIRLPKGRRLAQRWLMEARQALKPGGKLYLAGAKDEGIQSVLGDAAGLFGPATVLAYKKGNRIVRFVNNPDEKNLPEWTNAAGIPPGSFISFPVMLAGQHLLLDSLPGVFSADGLDEGTCLLLETIGPLAGARVLDAGCGSGVIGIAAALSGAARVDLVDANLVAVQTAQHNLIRLNISNARALASDALKSVENERYDLVLTNPPFHAGKGVNYDITYAMIQQASQVLDSPGQLILVSNQFIRYEKAIGEAFPSIKRLSLNSRYQVLCGIKEKS